MANLVMTTVDANTIKVEFNDYYPTSIAYLTAFYSRSEIREVRVFDNSVSVVTASGSDWSLSSTSGDGIFQVDDIDGTNTWADLTALAAQIAGLIIA